MTETAVKGKDVVAGPDGRRPNLPSLTGARWWAAVAVFVLHVLVFMPVYPFQKTELFANIHRFIPMQLGSAGVTYFFVLSGFIIYWSNSQMTSVWRYVKRRVLKLYPTHLLTAVIFMVAASVPLSNLVVWLPNLLLIHTWVPNWTTLGGLNIPSWSLVAELFFYLSFPLFIPLVRKVTGRGIWWAIGILFAGIVLLHTSYFLFLEGPGGIQNTFLPRFWPGDVSPHFEVHASPEWFAQDNIPVLPSYWMTYNFPLSRLPEFYLGVMAAKLVVEGRWRNQRLTLPLLAMVGAFAATWAVPVNFKMSVLFILPMMAVVATLAAKDIAGNTGMSGSPKMVVLGDISFAFYLIQFPVMVIVTRFFIGGHQYYFWGWLGWSALVFAVSLVAAWLIYTYIDAPIMRRAGRRKAKPAEPAPKQVESAESMVSQTV